MLLCAILASFAWFANGDSGDGWSIEYGTVIEGPRVVVSGIARLYFEEPNDNPCLSYCFDVPEGIITGPKTSSDPNQPMLAFDNVTISSKKVEIEWCEGPVDRHPMNENEVLQTLPMQVPRHFVFYVTKTNFGPEDLTKLLGDWGEADSPWDLNDDGTVNGADLLVVLSAWGNDNEGSP